MHELTRTDTTSAHVAEQQLIPAPARPVAPAEEAAPSPDRAPPTAPPQSEVGPPSRTLRLARGLVGAAMGTVGLVGDGLSTAQAVNKRVIKAAEVVTAPIRKPLDALGVTELAMRPVNAVTERVDSTVNQLEESGKSILQQSESLTLRTIDSTVDAVLAVKRAQPLAKERPVPVQIIMRPGWAGPNGVGARPDRDLVHGGKIDQREFRVGLAHVDDGDPLHHIM